MFTGLVEDTGTLAAIAPRGGGLQLTIRTALPTTGIAIGDSVAVNGVCLTAETVGPDRFTATAGRETLERTTLGRLAVGSRVHLERALRVGDRLGGHLVQGHVDGVGTFVSLERRRESWVLWIEAPPDLARYVASKGSVCLDGVSLTVNEVVGPRFRVGVVPHTASVTALCDHAAGDPVNIEVDVLAKYVERLLGVGPGGTGVGAASGGVTLELLQKNGFLT